MKELKICSSGQEKCINFEHNIKLSDAVRASGLSFSMPCNGNHTCGKCKIKLIGGKPNPISDKEGSFLTHEEINNNIRLACFTSITNDAQIILPEKTEEKIISSGILPGFTLNPPIGKKYGIAADIGTTTVVAYLYNLENGNLVTTMAEHNSQEGFGADVISRIQYTMANGVGPLEKAICGQLAYMFEHCCNNASISLNDIDSCIITGNTTMLHLLSGLDPAGIAVVPFTPKSLFGEFAPSINTKLRLAKTAKVFLPRCPSSYVGADITCSVLASGMADSKKTSLLVDVGTNGEMVITMNGCMCGCSTAAGPAFEGAGISMGMAATAGAVNTVFVENNEVRYTTIGGAEPVGLCGSGIIDSVAVMKQLELLDETGRIEEGSQKYPQLLTEVKGNPAFKIGESGVVVTQEDIRQIQLAKSAIAAGIDTLLHENSISRSQVDCFYLAGGFGSFINTKSAAKIGLIPEEFVSRTIVLGNAAGSGASLMLLSKLHFDNAAAIGSSIEDINLSTSPYFMDRYIDCIMF